MAHKSLLVVTAGDVLTNFPAMLPELAAYFATSQGKVCQLVDADPGDGSLSLIYDDCDRVAAGASANVGQDVVAAYRGADVILFDAGRSADNVEEIMPLLTSARGAAATHGRLAVAYLPCIFEGDPISLRSRRVIEAFVANDFKVRLAKPHFERRVGHLQAGKSLVRYGSIPPIGAGLVDLIRWTGPTLPAFLAEIKEGYGFAANHLRSWLNKCIDAAIFDDIIANDQLVAGTESFTSDHQILRSLTYKFADVAAIEDAHDDELFKRYPPIWSGERRDLFASIDQ